MRPAQPPPARAADVAAAVRGQLFQFTNEAGLHDALAGALAAAGLPADREVRLAPGERIDLMVGDVGVEVKVNGSPAQVRRQLSRYAETGKVTALVLVSTRALHTQLHGAVLHTEHGDVPVTVVTPAWM